MKKININKYWKNKKKLGFHIYFLLFSSVVITISVSIQAVLSQYLTPIIEEYMEFPTTFFWVIFSLIVGGILSYFVGKILLKPIADLKNLMQEVSEGNFDVKVNKVSIIDEVEDMYHYFNLMMSELRATEIIQSDFISNVSHEIKTPLNAINGYTTLLSDKDITNEEKDKYLEKILYNTDRINELITNILLISKVDNQAIETNNKLYSLDEQIRRSIVSLEQKWSVKNIEFNVELDSINYFGNSSLMMHVWNNLIGNAIKFSPENSEIIIVLREKEKNIEFIIEDKGPGIPKEEQKFIFNKFYQCDSSHKTEGNGLGLSLVSKILELVKGEITVKNIVPTGCQFKVTLKKH